MKYINKFNENNDFFDNVSPYIRNGYHLTKIDPNYKGKGNIVYLNDELANNFIELGTGYDEVIKLYSQLMTCPEISTRYWDIRKGENPQKTLPDGYKLYKLDRTNLEFIPYKSKYGFIPEYEQRDLYYGEPRKIDTVNGLIKSYKELRSLDAKKIDYVSQITILRKEENEKRHSI